MRTEGHPPAKPFLLLAGAGASRKLLQLPSPAQSAKTLQFNLSIISLGTATSLNPWLVVNTSSVRPSHDSDAEVTAACCSL